MYTGKQRSYSVTVILLWLLMIAGNTVPLYAQTVKAGVFNVDVTPPVGTPVAYAVARSVMDPLSARGVVILSNEKPVVLCAVDWIGIANEGLEIWQKQLAKPLTQPPTGCRYTRCTSTMGTLRFYYGEIV